MKIPENTKIEEVNFSNWSVDEVLEYLRRDKNNESTNKLADWLEELKLRRDAMFDAVRTLNPVCSHYG